MLTDIYNYDPSLPYTIASKRSNYLDFVRSREKSLGKGKHHEATFEDQLEPVTDVEDAILKMAAELLLPGLRPHELVILAQLCHFVSERLRRRRTSALECGLVNRPQRTARCDSY